MSKEIKRYFTHNLDKGNQALFTIPNNISFAQIDDMRVLLDTSYTDEVQEVIFSLWAVDNSGKIIARFFPNNYIIETQGTQTFVCFDTYIQIPAGSTIFTNVDGNYRNNGGSVKIATSVEIFN